MGALYNAKFSNSPIILTAGQQEQGHGLLEPLLYEPLVPIAQPLVKWAVEVTRVEDLLRILRRAVKVALTPPAGPVFVSLPGDVLEQSAELDLGRPGARGRVRPSDEALKHRRPALAARNPVIVAGQELAAHDACRRGGGACRAARRRGVRIVGPVRRAVRDRASRVHGQPDAQPEAGARDARAR